MNTPLKQILPVLALIVVATVVSVVASKSSPINPGGSCTGVSCTYPARVSLPLDATVPDSTVDVPTK